MKKSQVKAEVEDTTSADTPYRDKLSRHVSERRDQLLDISADVFCQKGLHQTTMDDIAEKLGVAKVVLYRYFGSRSGLIHAILNRVVERILAEDQKELTWWGEAIHRNTLVARENASSMLLLLRHSAHDPEYGHYFQDYHEDLVARTTQRLLETWDKPRLMPVDADFCSKTILMFIYDALARWLETGDPTKDLEFAVWVTDSIKAWSDRWGEGPSDPSLFIRS